MASPSALSVQPQSEPQHASPVATLPYCSRTFALTLSASEQHLGSQQAESSATSVFNAFDSMTSPSSISAYADILGQKKARFLTRRSRGDAPAADDPASTPRHP